MIDRIKNNPRDAQRGGLSKQLSGLTLYTWTMDNGEFNIESFTLKYIIKVDVTHRLTYYSTTTNSKSYYCNNDSFCSKYILDGAYLSKEEAFYNWLSWYNYYKTSHQQSDFKKHEILFNSKSMDKYRVTNPEWFI